MASDILSPSAVVGWVGSIPLLYGNAMALLAEMKYSPPAITVALGYVTSSEMIYSAAVDSLMYVSPPYVNSRTTFNVHDSLMVIVPSSISSHS